MTGPRPEQCNTTEETVVGPPWLSLTYTRSRRNRLTNVKAKR